jgi:sterol desaturase/sphingolipid hydroxylase (fatty acid hydroxylase superfamily)
VRVWLFFLAVFDGAIFVAFAMFSNPSPPPHHPPKNTQKKLQTNFNSAQHEFDALWRVHRVHHRIDTPSPLSTMYIHGLDATLQGGLPMALAAALVRPPPGVLCLAFATRVAENAANHSGLASPLLDLAFLKCLPLRAPVSWHDAHHKYCNHPRNARNYAESFVVWDWLFGTVNPRAGTPQGPLAAGDGKQAKE